MRIMKAGLDDVNEVAGLFNEYRKFYGEEDAPEECRRFILDRVTNDESTIFVARTASETAVGFTQLYPSFCSVAMTRLIYLYDLYVAEDARRNGVAQSLMEAARDHGVAIGAGRLQLETAADNYPAQSLYENLGWERDVKFYSYSLPLAPK